MISRVNVYGDSPPSPGLACQSCPWTRVTQKFLKLWSGGTASALGRLPVTVDIRFVVTVLARVPDLTCGLLLVLRVWCVLSLSGALLRGTSL